MTLGAVVVAYRDAAALDRCLDSLGAVSDVVVANVTTDPSVTDIIRARRRTEVPIGPNVGYAAAVNESLGRLPAECDTVLFVNDDVRLCSDPPAPDTVAVRIPRQRAPDDADVRVVHRLPTPLGFCREWILARPPAEGGVGQSLPSGTFANAAAIIAPRAVLQAHPLPSEYFLYWEEAAWFWRLADAGVPVRFDGAVVERPPGADELSVHKARLMGENLIRLAVERYGAAATGLYLLLGTAWMVRLVLTDSFRADRWRRWRVRAETMRGLRQGARLRRADRGRATVG